MEVYRDSIYNIELGILISIGHHIVNWDVSSLEDIYDYFIYVDGVCINDLLHKARNRIPVGACLQ